ncbi:MAG: Threonylcarbamoyl-AMP synthase [Phycisphaerae bacterium]|nr:Threonylcarbamoyl-AMP synthase [Phycisphaerae bacterium]
MGTVTIAAPQTAGYETALGDAVRAWRDGGLVIFPTETVYGIGANAFDPRGMGRLRLVKGRNDGRPFTLHLGQPADAANYVGEPSALLRRLVRRAWPGALTLIVHTDPAQAPIAQGSSAEQLGELYHDATIGLRCPDHPVAEYLLSAAQVPIVASSANRAGGPPPRDVHEALRDLPDAADFVVDGGRARLGSASTILEISGNEWKMVRSGSLDQRTIERMVESQILFVCTGNTCRSPMAAYMFRSALGAALRLTPQEMARQGYRVASAGIAAFAGAPISRGAREELLARGIDAGGHQSSALTVEALIRAERVFAMTEEHRRAVLDLAPGMAHKLALLDPASPVRDPAGGTSEEYQRCARQIEAAIRTRVEEFVNEDRHWQ